MFSPPGSADPNDINGPAGAGEEHWLSASEPIFYTIRFENDPELATGPAQVIRVTQLLDSNLDPRTFRLGTIGFGDLIIAVPENRAFYSTRLDLRDKFGIYVDVIAGVDVATAEVFWQLTSIDPGTGQVPADRSIGFLPPNMTPPEGDGFVTYTVRPKSNVPHGTRIDALATILFDDNPPLDTPAIFHTLDADSPTSSVAALPPRVDDNRFRVRWSGDDGDKGSGIASYDVYVSENGGPYALWLDDTTLTEAEFVGELGQNYSFYSVAKDAVGNEELPPENPDASTHVNVRFFLSGSDSTVRNQETPFEFYVDGLSPVATFGYILQFDWDNNGSVDGSALGFSGSTAYHTFHEQGLQTIRAQLLDSTGAVAAETELSIDVLPSRLLARPGEPEISDLLISGSDTNDRWRIEELDPTTIRVSTLLENGDVSSSTIYDGVTGGIQLFAGAGDDYIDASQLQTKTARIFGDNGNDTIMAGAGDDYIDADGPEGRGNDSIDGGGGNDMIYADGPEGYDAADAFGRDTIRGGDGDDLIHGDGAEGSDDDLIYGDAGNDTIYADGAEGYREHQSYGKDTVSGGTGDDVIISDGAEGADDEITGDEGNDVILAGGGNDIGNGGANADIIVAGLGADSIDGAAGSDLLIAGDIDGLDLASILLIQSEWASERPIEVRVDNIRGVGAEPRNNGAAFLSDNHLSLADNAIDTVLGGDDEDWLLVETDADVLPDLMLGDVLINV